MYYIITNNQAVFFNDREAAEDFQETNYYLCSGDIGRVPSGATHYSVKDIRGMVRCVWFDESAEEGRPIVVEGCGNV